MVTGKEIIAITKLHPQVLHHQMHAENTTKENVLLAAAANTTINVHTVSNLDTLYSHVTN